MFIPDDLYWKICQVMPIPCVDLLVSDARGRVLLVKRKNEPAAGQWWFPGGRVHYLETRENAALRKLKEECGIEAVAIKEVGTFDVILDGSAMRLWSHGITTLFHVCVVDSHPLTLDRQSVAADWRLPEDWKRESLHFFVREGLNLTSPK